MKQKLRIEKLLKRKSQDPLQKSAGDRKILQKLARLGLFKKAKKILFYLPIHGEVDLTDLFKKFHKKKSFILPRMKGKTLELHAIKNLTHTAKGRYDVLEPHKHLPKINPMDIDLLLIPGVVFSEEGHRIGYGKGFYDRLLKKACCHKIGIAYEFQIVKNIPGEPHDVPMDMIMTEQRTLKVKRKKLHAAKRGK